MMMNSNDRVFKITTVTTACIPRPSRILCDSRVAIWLALWKPRILRLIDGRTSWPCQRKTNGSNKGLSIGPSYCHGLKASSGVLTGRPRP